MTTWIKSVLIFIGIVACSAVHFFWPHKPQEEMCDVIIQRMVEEYAGVDLEPMDEAVDTLIDDLHNGDKN